MAVAWSFWVFLNIAVVCSVGVAEAASVHKRYKRELRYPNQNYPNGFNQTFPIQTAHNRACQVTINGSADIEFSPGCVYDRLVLSKGKPDQEIICGIRTFSYNTIVTDGSDVVVSFQSDVAVQSGGYSLVYRVETIGDSAVVPKRRTIKDKPPNFGSYYMEIWGDRGNFTSPNYPNNYPGNFDGNYVAHLSNPGPQKVRVNYNYDIENQARCLFDFLEFSDTEERVCGSGQKVRDIPVRGDTFNLRFHTDNNSHLKGFQLTYEVLNQPSHIFSRTALLPEKYSSSNAKPVESSPEHNVTSGEVCQLCEWTQIGMYEYKYNGRMLTFDDAVTACRKCGGEMATAVNQEEFNSTQHIIQTLSGLVAVPHWLAATDRDSEGRWTWLDGSPLTYTQWKRREPNNVDASYDNADCLLVNSMGQWRDQACNNLRRSLCRRPRGLADCVPPPDEEVVPTGSEPLPTGTPVPSPENPADRIEKIKVFLPSARSCCSLDVWRWYGPHEFSYNHAMLTFEQAESECVACGGHLATARNDDEFALTQRVFKQLSGSDDTPHWLAATDRDQEGQWTWLDGTRLTYSQWNRREPDNQARGADNADCLVVNSRGQWRDESCHSLRKSLCVRPRGTTVHYTSMCTYTKDETPGPRFYPTESSDTTPASLPAHPTPESRRFTEQPGTSFPHEPDYSTTTPFYSSDEPGDYASSAPVYKTSSGRTHSPSHTPAHFTSHSPAHFTSHSPAHFTSHSPTHFTSHSPAHFTSDRTPYYPYTQPLYCVPYGTTNDNPSGQTSYEYTPSQATATPHPSEEPTHYYYTSSETTTNSPSLERTDYVTPAYYPSYKPTYFPAGRSSDESVFRATTQPPADYTSSQTIYRTSGEPTHFPAFYKFDESVSHTTTQTAADYTASKNAFYPSSRVPTHYPTSEAVPSESYRSLSPTDFYHVAGGDSFPAESSSSHQYVIGNSGNLTSTNYPRSYPRNENYERTVVLEQAGPQTVSLRLVDFDLEWNANCEYDYVLVVVNGIHRNKLCGLRSGETIQVNVPDYTFTLLFHSDDSGEGRGFNIYYRTVL